MPNLTDIRLFLFDMDGTLYLGDRLFPFTKPLLARIRETGRRYMFLTNNSSKSVADYVRKLARLGIEATEDDFLTSGQATAHYLKKNWGNRRIYVGGTKSLLAEFAAAGLNVTDRYGEDIEGVVCGFDTELTFAKLDNLSRLLTKGLPYIATHPDMVCPTEYGFVPDCGAVCEMLFHATGRRPEAVIGKPEPLMPQMAMKIAGVTPEETAVVGDRLHTDIESGLRAGAMGVLVFSGETTPEILAASPTRPSMTLADCGEILAALL